MPTNGVSFWMVKGAGFCVGRRFESYCKYGGGDTAKTELDARNEGCGISICDDLDAALILP